MRKFRSPLRLKSPVAWPAPRPAEVIYAIGDIHGRADLLDVLMTRIHADIDRHRPESPLIVFLGDYVDRGDSSAEVLARLHAAGAGGAVPIICLMGNHERMMLDFLAAPESAGALWLANGGLQTLASFGVGQVTPRSGAAQLAIACSQMRAAMPKGMEDWLRDLPHLYRSGDVVLAHAGLSPARSVEDQTVRQLIWGGQDHLKIQRRDGLWVVHGHYSDADAPLIAGGRISIDTGAWYSNRLTAAVIGAPGGVRFLRT